MPRLPRALLLSLSLTFAGCGSGAEAVPDPRTVAIARLAAESDPIAKVALLREMARDPSVPLAAVCESLTDSLSAYECDRLSKRPHLRKPQWFDSPRVGVWDLWLPAQARGPLAGVTAAPDPGCAGLETAERGGV